MTKVTRYFFECAVNNSLIECHPSAFGRSQFESDYAVTAWVFDLHQTSDFGYLETISRIEQEVLHILNYHHPKDGLMVR